MILGAITGDVIGSYYEHSNTKKTDFQLFSTNSRFTDDTVLTVATMDCLLSEKRDYTHFYQKYARKYPHSGFGYIFRSQWIFCLIHNLTTVMAAFLNCLRLKL